MLYYIASLLTPKFGVFNVFNYHTVRAGGAMVTGFLFCILVGPRLIDALRRLKVGQYIRQEHVQDLHALHKGKAGTPTMGGTLIVLSTVLSLALWSTLENRLMVVALAMLCFMGAVGFLDDFIKLRRKHNDGLSARAKIAGQVIAGTALGLFVVLEPITFGASLLSESEVQDWDGFKNVLAGMDTHSHGGPWERELGGGVARFSSFLPPDVREWLPGEELTVREKNALVSSLNDILSRPEVYDASVWPPGELDPEAQGLVAKGVASLNSREVVRLNRLLLESSSAGFISVSPKQMHTKVGVPGIKDAFIPLGPFYVLFVILIIVAMTNAVNLTDGLDGLAVGASMISIFAFTAIAYVVSRADWSDYLYVLHVPEASELTVFGSALLGTSLGFLWFNAHPAEVFMGDTGSLALGGVIGAMAVLTKQELLLPIVGGLFVLEFGSVVIQVSCFKLTGRRVFRMAPLHHHFELKGWSESKVTIRFWILALIFALMSMATLKLR